MLFMTLYPFFPVQYILTYIIELYNSTVFFTILFFLQSCCKTSKRNGIWGHYQCKTENEAK